MTYEGHVKYADDTEVSLQCYDGRHQECPQCEIPSGTENDLNGPLKGHHCECSCDHGASDEDRECKQCGDTVQYLSTDDLCDGCLEEAS